MTGIPVIRNVLTKDVTLADVMGPASLFSLAEAPIQNFTLMDGVHVATWSAHKGVWAGYERTGWNGTRWAKSTFATGRAAALSPRLPQACKFLGPPAGPWAHRF